MTFAAFQKALADKSLPPVLVFHGDEPFLASLGVDLLKKHLLSPGSEAFDFVSMSGSETTAEAVAAHAATVPMLSEKRLTVVYEFLGLAPSQRTQLLAYVRNPVPSACVALVSFQRLTGKNKFERELLDEAEPVDCGRPSGETLAALVTRMSEKRGRKIDEEAVSALVDWTDGRLNRISNELDKLDCFASEGAPIGLAEVEIVVGARTSGLRDLAVAVAERKTGRALALLDELVDGGMSEAQLVSQLYGCWISLWLARTGGSGARGHGGGSYERLWSSRAQLTELAAGRTSRDYARGVGSVLQGGRRHQTRHASRAYGGPPRLRTHRGRALAMPARRDSAGRRLARIGKLLEGVYGRPRRRTRRDLIAGLVGTILSQNTSDTNSHRAFVSLRKRFPDWGDVESANVRSIESAIRSGGLARTKARTIKRALRDIHARAGKLDLGFLRRMSDDEVFDYLLAFDGVGTKTAACVALFDLGRDVMPVDTHVHRVTGRLGVVGHPRSRDGTFEALREVVPPGESLSLHVNLIHLGRALCRPRDPDCSRCPVMHRV